MNICKQFIDHGCSYAWNEMLCAYDLQILGVLTQPFTIDTYIAYLLKYKEYAQEHPIQTSQSSSTVALLHHLIEFRSCLVQQHIDPDELQCFDGIVILYTSYDENTSSYISSKKICNSGMIIFGVKIKYCIIKGFIYIPFMNYSIIVTTTNNNNNALT